MTFKEALETIVSSGRYDACKRPSMSGYVFRSAIGTGENEGDYTLTFVKRGAAAPTGTPVADQPSYTEYQLEYDNSATPGSKWRVVSGKTAPSLAEEAAAELWEELLGNDWFVGAKDDFERARIPDSGDVW